MKSIDQKQWQEFIDKAGIVMPDGELSIGPALIFRDGPMQRLVVHFTDRDFPVGLSRKLGVLLSIQEGWYLFPRIGGFPVSLYEADKTGDLKHLLVQEQSEMVFEENDLFVVGVSGNIIVSYDHLFLDEGLRVYIQDAELADTLLALLIDSGVKAELISNTP